MGPQAQQNFSGGDPRGGGEGNGRQGERKRNGIAQGVHRGTAMCNQAKEVAQDVTDTCPLRRCPPAFPSPYSFQTEHSTRILQALEAPSRRRAHGTSGTLLDPLKPADFIG